MSDPDSLVLIGFVDQFIKDESSINWFTNKIGGKPLFPKSIDDSVLSSLTNDRLICPNCSTLSLFLCSIQCPVDDKPVNRVFYVFACQRHQCDYFTAIRLMCPLSVSQQHQTSSLNRRVWDTNDDWSNNSDYAIGDNSSQDNFLTNQQSINDEEEMRIPCSGNKTLPAVEGNCIPFKPYYVYVEDENELKENKKHQINHHFAISEEQLIEPEENGEKYENIEVKTVFSNDSVSYKFYKRLRDYPEQLIRYSWKGSPLLNRSSADLTVDPCDNCGAPRVFEFQLMPGLISQLKPSDSSSQLIYNLDFGTVLIFSCSNNCNHNGVNFEKCIFLEDVDKNVLDEYVSRV